MSNWKQKAFFIFEGVDSFEIIIPSFDVLLAIGFGGDLDEIFSLQVFEVLEFLVVYFDIIVFVVCFLIVLLRSFAAHPI